MVMQVSARTKNKSCIYRTMDSRKQDAEEDFGKAASVGKSQLNGWSRCWAVSERGGCFEVEREEGLQYICS